MIGRTGGLCSNDPIIYGLLTSLTVFVVGSLVTRRREAPASEAPIARARAGVA